MSILPKNWIKCQIGEVTQIIGGGTPPSKDPTNFTSEGGIPWVTPADLSGYKDMFISHGARNLTEKGFKSCAGTLMPAGSVLFSSRAPVGYVAIAANELATNQGFKSFILPKELESRYIYYYLRYIKPIAEEMATGTTFKELSGSTSARLPLLIAPLNEQKRVADKLDTLLGRVDTCREHLERVPGILKRFRQAVLAAATSGRLTEEWRETKRISLDSWKEKRGEEVFPFITSGSRGWAAYYSESGSKFIRIGNLDHDTIDLDLSEIQYVNPPNNAEGKRTRIEVGDILISITADLGMVALIREDIGESYINQHICLARQTGEYLGAFLAYYLASPTGLAQFDNSQRGMTKLGLTLGDIKALTFRIPEVEEQHEIVRRVEILFAYADRLEAQYQVARNKVDSLTPALLAKAFRGELVEQDASDEPAGVLLERVRGLNHLRGL